MITEANNSNCNRKTTIIKSIKHYWEKKQLYGYVKQPIKEIAHEMARTWSQKIKI